MKSATMVLLPVAMAAACCHASHAQQPVEWAQSEGGNGHWYRVVAGTSDLSWNEARDHAEAAGGHLATVTSAAENAWLHARSLECPGAFSTHGPWLGGVRVDDSWRWVTGEPWGFTAWTPENPSGDGTSVGFWRVTDPAEASWNDAPESNVMVSYAVEWDSDCNGDGIVDYGQIRSGQLVDSDGNGVPDACETGLQPIHAYDLQSGVLDRIGSAHGVLENGAAIVDGALRTDGVNDHVRFPGRIIPTSGPFTVALRFKTLSVPPGWMELISQGCSGCGAFYLGSSLSGQWRYWLDDVTVQTGIPFPIDGSWHHVAATFQPGGMTRLYVDGTMVREYPATPLADTGGPTRLACQFDLHENHHGFIDDLRIFGAELSALEVARLAGACPADIVVDGSVDGADLGIQLSQWGPAAPGTAGDLNADGTVDGADLSTLLSSWGPCP